MLFRGTLLLYLILVFTETSSTRCRRKKSILPVTNNGQRKGTIYHLTPDGDIEELDKSQATYQTIINKSVDVLIQSEGEEHVTEFLNDFYFTTDQESSVWAKAMEGKRVESRKHRKKLKRMQDIVKKIYVKWLDCKDLNSAKPECKCYFEMHQLIEEGEEEFKLGGNDIESDALLFDLNVAYDMMSLIVYHLTIHVAIFAPQPAISIRNAYFKVADYMLDTLDDLINNITKARVDKISDVEICRVDEILWLDYPGKCECYNCDKKSFASAPSQRNRFYTIEGNESVEKYNAKVVDHDNDTVICDETDEAKSKSDKHSVEVDLFSTCSDLRKPYIRKLKKETRNIYEKRTEKIRKYIPTLWGMSRKKYSG